MSLEKRTSTEVSSSSRRTFWKKATVATAGGVGILFGFAKPAAACIYEDVCVGFGTTDTKLCRITRCAGQQPYCRCVSQPCSPVSSCLDNPCGC